MEKNKVNITLYSQSLQSGEGEGKREGKKAISKGRRLLSWASQLQPLPEWRGSKIERSHFAIKSGMPLQS